MAIQSPTCPYMRKGESLGAGVQGPAVCVFEDLCICALHVFVSLEINHFSRRNWVDYGITEPVGLPIVPIALYH